MSVGWLCLIFHLSSLLQALLTTLLALTQAARLDNKYLPPPANAASAGGGVGAGLQGPGGGGGGGGGGGFGGSNNGLGGINNGLGGFSGGGGPSRPIGGAPAPRPAAPAPPAGGPPIPILSFVNENDGDGNYRFSYETGNGIKAQEEGTVKNKGSANEIPSVMGSYTYTNPEGELVEISYTADENGFVPSGAALPTPPPIPEAIAKALAAQGISPLPGGGYSGGAGELTS
ncbi:hypothetical protein AWZ03_002792 [Drosophila navojoa]|uniref:Uncharacterized protein n=1 Tax=Drosophila navojoa TaxID=7232 RepID=A0A484BPY4_DRONA|nr:hypothetical protein AWZ03_002792 [Drosophila navojoa]